MFCYHDSGLHFKDGKTSTDRPDNVIGLHSFHSPFYTDNLPRTIRLFGISPSEIRNACYRVADILGAEGRRIEDRLNNSGSMEERISILDSFFAERLRLMRSGTCSGKLDGKTGETAAALQLIRKSGGQIKVREIAEALSLPRRTMEWQFSHHTELTPKEFARIVRFNNLLNDILDREPVCWAETAISEEAVQVVPLTTAITPLTNNVATSQTPSFDFTATSTYSPTTPPIQNVCYAVDTWENGWLRASGSGSFAGTTDTLTLGNHVLYAYATDGEDAGSINTVAPVRSSAG
ncbi:MAG: hypothetical protein M1378_02140 [Bacteroidetes bacterium]|nr:hypothetical protein [Bacteroidota bacterium]MCL5035199.1 hypothetical protein [Bacteroidota bacterium]